MSSDPDLSIIAYCLRRVRGGLLKLSLGGLAVAIFSAVVGLVLGEASSPVIGIGGAAVFITLVSLIFLLRNVKIESSPIYRMLRETPERIVWIYTQAMTNRILWIQLSTYYNVHLHLDDGRLIRLQSVPTNYIEEVMDVIEGQAPAATFGYSSQAETSFKKDPKSLINPIDVSGELEQPGEQLEEALYQSTRSKVESLFHACWDGDLERVKEIIAEGNHDVNGGNYWQTDIDPNGWERSPLFIASLRGYLELVRYLLGEGADVNTQTKYGDTPLHAGVQSGSVALGTTLLKHGANPKTGNDEDETPLDVARKSGKEEIARILELKTES